MRAKLKAGGHASPYRLRKQLPEPVFGQVKQARGFRQFLMRGLDKVSGEWAIICTAHYADVWIMPTCAWKSAGEAEIAPTRSA